MFVLGVDPGEVDRFWARVDKTPECWNWTAGTDKGYGAVRSSAFGGRPTYTHRVSFYYATGIRSGREQQLDHLCRNRKCVRPDHLQLVTQEVNVLRGEGPTALNLRKTECDYGHPFTPENTMPHGGGRKCRECHRRISREWARKHRREAGVNVRTRS